jgi:hypothetical protein
MGSKPSMPGTEKERLSPKICWEVLERVAGSTYLNRAARLREFLFYVGNRSLKDGAWEIHEQEIGSEVFGRDGHYDTSQDNIVRVNATELRKRIDAYFLSEGSAEPIVFQIPRGSYTPVFRVRAEEPAPPAEAPAAAATTEPPAKADSTAIKGSPLPVVLALAAAASMLVLCLFLWTQNQSLNRRLHPWQSQPAMARFWQPFLQTSRETDIVLADTSFALVEDVTGQSLSLTDYLNHNYTAAVLSPNLSADRKADLSLIVSRLNGSLGDFRVAQRVEALDPASSNLSLQFAREYTADAIKRNNVILIGSRKSNPWVDLFNDQLNFTVDYDPKLNQSFIVNHNPRPGEQGRYAAPVNPYASAGYSIIAFLPNPSHTADALIIAGTDSQATDAGGEFLTSETSLASLLKRVPSKQIPYFEVLLKTTRLSGTPFNAEIIAFRTY